MKRLGYFEKLSLAARWFLPHDEAVSMVEDYKDILYEVSGPEEAVERFGPPWKPVMELADRKKVRRWHMYFILMIFCAFVPFMTIIWEKAMHDCYLMYNYFYFLEPAGDVLLCGVAYMFGLDIIMGGSHSRALTRMSVVLLTAVGIFIVLLHPAKLLDTLLSPIDRMVFGRNLSDSIEIEYYLIIGGIISMFYFGLGKKRGKPLPKLLIICLCTALFAAACVYGFLMYCFHVDFWPMFHNISIMNLVFEIAAMLFLLGAIDGIVMAKMADPRWRAAYILCIMGIILCFEVHNQWWNMDPSIWIVQVVDGYCVEMAPTSEWAHAVTKYCTCDLACGIILAAVGLL